MTYTVWVERGNGTLREFEDVRDAMNLPTGAVRVVTAEGVELKVPKADIMRIKHSDA